MNELERRVRICRMLEKMNRSREYSEVLKLEDKSIYKLSNMNTKKMLIALFTIIYVISPIDLLPGIPVDDMAVVAVGAYQMLSTVTQEES